MWPNPEKHLSDKGHELNQTERIIWPTVDFSGNQSIRWSLKKEQPKTCCLQMKTSSPQYNCIPVGYNVYLSRKSTMYCCYGKQYGASSKN